MSSDRIGAPEGADAGRRRPNVLLLCTDQQRFDALGCYGNDAIQTPALDAFAGEGALFERCYVQSPVCAPSRATFFTGLYPHNHGLWANGVALPPGRTFFTRLLADAGYDCGLIGKLHLAACEQGRTEPRQDDGLATFEWAHDPDPGSPENAYHRWLKVRHPDLHRLAFSASEHRSRGEAPFKTLPAEGHYSHWVAERAIAFMRRERTPDQPFFLMANFFDPHHAFGAPEEYLARYRGVEIPPPVTGPAELDGKPAMQREASRESYAGFAPGFQSYEAGEIAEIRRAYYAMVSLVDDEVRRILGCLDELGLRDDTLVVFTSDHGEMLGDHELLLKGPVMYDPAVRVPLMLRWPGVVPAGVRRDELVQWIDLPSTLMAAAGVPAPGQLQGSDLLPLAAKSGPWTRDWALCEYRNSGHPYDPPVHTTMLRQGRHKLVRWHGRGGREPEGELYDLEADPSELVNLWADPGQARTRLRLTELLLDVLVATEDRRQPREANW
jgi:arylsulfatase A-like enzyme